MEQIKRAEWRKSPVRATRSPCRLVEYFVRGVTLYYYTSELQRFSCMQSGGLRKGLALVDVLSVSAPGGRISGGIGLAQLTSFVIRLEISNLDEFIVGSAQLV